MGGDVGPPVTVPAALLALQKYQELELTLIGDQQVFEPVLAQHLDKLRGRLTPSQRDRLHVIHTEYTISNADHPASILRTRRNSSMFLAVEQVHKGQADACVSAGNTGALLLAGRHLLKTIPGIEKPAIMAIIPGTRAGDSSYLLDVGANVRNDANELYQFARMGAVLAASLSGRETARVALLNIGEEANKGTPAIQQAAELLSTCEDIDFCGYIEGNQLFNGLVDVIVCDGFTGNITIKTSAGAVHAMQRLMQNSLTQRWYYRAFGWALKPLLRDLSHEINPSRYNGATLIGLQGIIIKSHGNADCAGFVHAIEHALNQINDNVPALIAGKMAPLQRQAN